MYQKCPVCEGSGNIVNFKGKITKDSVCPTCEGKRIISTKTGLPPGELPSNAASNVVLPIKINGEWFPRQEEELIRSHGHQLEYD